MKFILFVFLLSASTLFAQKAPFASQSDLVADLSDGVLGDIYHHRLGFDRYACERSVWVEGLGNFRRRDSSSERSRYDNWFGGVVGGFNYALSCDNYLNFFVGGSYGEINICNESDFDTDSAFFGMSWEKLCDCSFFGFAIAGGYLAEERRFSDVHEEPRGVFFTPEMTYARQFDCQCISPVFTSTLRYAGFFPRDYQHRETLGTLHVQERSIQLFTLRGEFSAPFRLCYGLFAPYLGVAGRFQFYGNHVDGRLVQNHESFSDGIDNILGYGFLGLRASRQCRCFDLQANLEGSYDSDESWRFLGELSLNYMY